MRAIFAAVGVTFLLAGATALGQMFDVLTYRHAPNPTGIPENWPARVQPVANTNRPPAENWIRVTREQLETYKATHQAAYANWEAQREAARRDAEETRTRDRDDLISATITRIERDIPRLETAITNFDTLTTAQRWSVMREMLELIQLMARVQQAQLNDLLQ